MHVTRVAPNYRASGLVLWHKGVAPTYSTHVRTWGTNGLTADMMERPFVTRTRRVILAAHTFHRRTELLRNCGARVSGET